GGLSAGAPLGRVPKAWFFDLPRRSLTPLMWEGRNLRAIWTPDGRRLTFGPPPPGDENLFWKPIDGTAPAERLSACDCLQTAAMWSPDGRTLVFTEDKTSNRIMRSLTMDG